MSTGLRLRRAAAPPHVPEVAAPSIHGVLPVRPSAGPIVPGSIRLRPARPIPSTTHQVEVLNTAMIAAPTGHEGICIGRDRLSGSMVAHDPFTAYKNRIITSPNVVNLGVIGAGKSALNKTCYGLRPLILGGRRAVVFDRKPRGDVGEYTEMVKRFGGEAFLMMLDSSGTSSNGAGTKRTRMNPLDPVILRGAGAEAQLRLLRAMAEIARRGDEPLDPWQEKAIRIARTGALRSAELDQGRAPYLEDFVPLLGDLASVPDAMKAELRELSPAARDRLHQAGVEMRFVFEATIQESLSGMFDGPTSPHVQLQTQLSSFDISQLPPDGPAVPLVISIAHMWLMGMLRYEKGMQTTCLNEEGWHLIEGPGGRLMRSNQKLSRALGLSNVFTIHHLADVPADSPGMSVLREAQTVHIYRQDRTDDIDAVVRQYSLSPSSRETLATLPNGEHLLKIGDRPEIRVQHVRSAIEVAITDTDEAMIPVADVVAARRQA